MTIFSIEPSRPPEVSQGSNGMTHWFKFDGHEFMLQLRFTDGNPSSHLGHVFSDYKSRPEWFPHRYPTLRETIDPLTAVNMLEILQTNYNQGVAAGNTQARLAIRKALGL